MNDTTENPGAEGRELTGLIIIMSIWRNRRLIARNVVGMAILSVITALLLPVWFVSQFTILPASLGNQDILSGIMGIGNPLAGLGFGVSSEELNGYISILKSREVRDHIITEFDLLEDYDVKTIEDALFILDERIDINISDEGALRIALMDRDPQAAKALAEGFLNALGQTMTDLGHAMGQHQKRFIASRIAAVETELVQIEEELKEFTREYGTFDLPAQIPVVMEKLVEMEIQLIQAEIEYSVASSNAYQGDPAVAILLSQRDEIRKQLDGIIHGKSRNNIIPNLELLPDISVQYARFQRGVLILATLLEYLYPQLEQARLKEAKDEPTLQILDYPKLPQKKAKPHRSVIVISATMFSLLTTCVWVVFRPRLEATIEALKAMGAG
ncbi:MAG: hypothetical protein IIA59_08385 [Candidatus Marinimicrobia bacterium]|nr:hypothetical protein [Candidatus Neomarinimicrobiota bacterium]